MPRHRITRGLRLPIAGEPTGPLEDARPLRRVGLVAADCVGLRPTMHVAVGDTVSRGQLLFEDKTLPGVRYTAPAAGTVRAINRGARRALQSVVIEQSRAEREGRTPETAGFGSWTGRHPSGMTEGEVRDVLLESGQWTALRARPHSRVADPATRPHSIFVTAVDTNPLAPDVAAIVEGRQGAFERGLAALARLTPGPVFVCTGPDQNMRVPVSASNQIRHEVFEGVHPAGTVGVHIHTLDPVDRGKLVWHVGVQDVDRHRPAVRDRGPRRVAGGGAGRPAGFPSPPASDADRRVDRGAGGRGMSIPARNTASSPAPSCPAAPRWETSRGTSDATISRCRCWKRGASGSFSVGSARASTPSRRYAPSRPVWFRAAASR